MRCAPLLWLAVLAVSTAGAAPYVPRDGAEVLERVRERPLDASAREMRELRAALARDPQNLALALRAARRYVAEARAQGDPRYLGYAQAALHPWWTLPQPPPAVLVLRATIRQSNHDFDAALADLGQALAAAPNDAQAWLTRAAILQLKGDYDGAGRSCERLSRIAPPYVTSACLADVGAMTGRAEESYAAYTRILERETGAPPAQKVWLETALAEIAVRLDRRDRAEQHFRRALAHGVADPYLKAAYADFLLDAARPSEVTRLLAADTRVDALLLRLALADRALGSADVAARIASLTARFDAARARGDTVHRREEARFRLTLLGDARAALRLAQENWAVQKEPADARALLEAALAAGDADAAQPVVAWMARNGVEDAGLARLAQRLRGS